MNKVLEFSTKKKIELLNITEAVSKVVTEANKEEGQCLVFAPHATAAILINEDETGFKADVENLLKKWIPDGSWEHNKVDSNATAHLAASVIGQSRAIPVKDGNMQLGTWQEIFLVEFDGPREKRKVIVQVS